LLLGSLTLGTSCSSDSASPATVTQIPGSKGTMTATVGGQSFAANFSTATRSSGIVSISGNNISTTTTTGMTKQINISAQISQAGKYQMGLGGGLAGNFVTAVYAEGTGTSGGVSGLTGYTSTAGELNVTEFTATKIKGTFSFSGRSNSGQVLAISGGSFDIAF
jgi:hypothetical protein